MRVVLFYLLMGFGLTGFGQESYLRHYSTNEGLPGSETYKVFQDHKGYIWVASDMGVSRYDGYNFRVFTTADGLTDNTIFQFYEDSIGRMWFYTFSGKICYYFNDTIYSSNFTVNDQLRDFVGPGSTSGMRVNRNNVLLLSSSKGLLKFTPTIKNGLPFWDKIEVINNKRSFLLRHGYLTLEPTGENMAMVIKYIDGASPDSIKIPHDWESISGEFEFRDGSILLSSDYKAICIDPTGKTELRNDLKFVTGVTEESDSSVWLSFKKGGARLFTDRSFTKSIKTILQPLSVTCVLHDHENGYWYSTLEDGIFFIPSGKFSYLPFPAKAPSNPKGITFLDNDRVVVLRDRLYSTLAFGIGNNTLHNISKVSEAKNNNPWYLLLHSNGEIWAATNITSLEIFTPDGKSMVDGLDERMIRDNPIQLIESKDHNVWALSHALLTEVDYRQKKKIVQIELPSRAETMCEGFNGNILIGTLNGLYSYSNNKLNYLGTQKPIFKSRFTAIEKYDNKIVCATRGTGVIIIDGESVYRISTAQGLLSNMCRSAFVDEQKVIWVATNRGVNAIRITENPYKAVLDSFTVSEGLLSNDNNSVMKTGNDLWLLSQKGITVFNPDQAIMNKVPPPVYIEKLLINNVSYKPREHNEFDYSTNFIEIEFTGLTFKNPGKQLYKYKLQGYDTSWNYTRNTYIQFTKLPPGNYLFKVSCINNSGIESASPAVFAFSIKTPFYRKWSFILLLVAISIGLIALVSVLVVRRIREREMIKTEINRKMAKLELHALRAQMNPHFIFNCLNAIQDFILKNEPMQAKHYLSSFSKLIRKTLDNSRKATISLSEEISFLKLYLELESMRFSGKFDYSITVEPEVVADNIDIPGMLLQPFIENAIRHGRIGNMEVKGCVKIIFSIKDHMLVCEISDNGIGLNKAMELKKDQPKTSQIHALDIMKERVQTINELTQSHIRYSIMDKAGNGGLETGTDVIIYIPLEDEL